MQSHRASGIEYNAGRAGKGVSSMRRKTVLVSALLAVLLIAAFACWPRRADLRAFDSAGMARREGMTERDWAEIEGRLLQAYKLLKAGIGGP